jgi:predicted N-formylglutamate amidohydrolase
VRSLVVTCEHAGNRVPAEWRHLWRGRGPLLRSHRGWDPGALRLARAFGGRLFFSTTTRLLVDLNRSIDNPAVFSEFTRKLPRADRLRILARHYLPYRVAATQAIEAAMPVVHLSVHTFTPVLRGRVRPMDVGLLFDPARSGERTFCERWRAPLRAAGLVVHFNAPYRGTSDGFATWLRGLFPERRYLGIELEVNQRHARRGGAAWRRLARTLVESFEAARRV